MTNVTFAVSCHELVSWPRSACSPTRRAREHPAVLRRRGEHLDAKNVLGSAVSVVRAAIPTHAYEVSVTLTMQAAEPPAKSRCGVTAQVSRLPNEGIPVQTAWAHSWDDAIAQAADMVTAAVLPRTVLSNRQPWSGWRRYPMPGMLVHHYEKAQELTTPAPVRRRARSLLPGARA